MARSNHYRNIDIGQGSKLLQQQELSLVNSSVCYCEYLPTGTPAMEPAKGGSLKL